MCGFYGMIFVDQGAKVSFEQVKKPTDAMVHRGPDDWGVFIDGNVGLGHRRLSIIDLTGGHQPMFNEDRSIVVVYNGEIYNFKEIKDELVLKGHAFKTDCDTEVIVHAYEEWGRECVQRFNGMFGFALWDRKNKRIWLVRDRLGIKPVYYFFNGKVLLFASEIKALLATGLVPRELNNRVLDAYFTLGYVPGPQTMFDRIMKLMPGHFIVFEGREIRDVQYWDFAGINDGYVSPDAALERVDCLLRDSVRKRLMSDVPLGVFLSGGLDSSAVVALMSEVVPSQKIKTFTVSYDPKYHVGEHAYAKLISDRFNTEHHVLRLEPENFFDSVETLVEYAEDPIVEPAAIALYHLSKQAREHAIVLLSGEGSDEVFGGYFLYDLMNRVNTFQRFMPRAIQRLLRLMVGLSDDLKIKKYADWFFTPVEKSYFGTSNYLTRMIKKEIYTPDFYNSKGDYLKGVFDGYFDKVKNKNDFLNKLLYVDTKTWLADDLLIKADKMTMAASIELRVPFLDYRLVELAASFTSQHKIKAGAGKYILKQAMKHRLPNEIVTRKKMGFPVPTNNWFCVDIYFQLRDILKDNLPDLPWLRSSFIERMLIEHKKGAADHAKLLMMLLVFVMWKKRFISNL